MAKKDPVIPAADKADRLLCLCQGLTVLMYEEGTMSWTVLMKGNERTER